MSWTDAKLNLGASLRQALAAIESGGLGIVIVTDERDQLVGVMTGRDTRQALLNGIHLSDSIDSIINRQPVIATPDMDDQELLELMRSSQRFQIPVVDASHRVVALRVIQELTQGTPLSVPNLAGNEWTYVKDCLDTNFVSSVGRYVTEFEKRVSTYVGVRHGIACSSGTSALHIAGLLAGLDAHSEFIAPTLTFIASINGLHYSGATPIFLDANKCTLGLCPKALESFLETRTEMGLDGFTYNKLTKRRIKCLMVAHVFGHPADMDPIMGLAERFNLVVIEDAAESLAARYKGRQTGSIGHIGCLSFNGNKIITTGGGGMLLTDNETYARRAHHLTTQAKTNGFRYEHDEIGFNYRLSNVLAAIGVAQMEQLDAHLARKREIANDYMEVLRGVDGVRIFQEKPDVLSNYWLNTIFVSDNRRDRILTALNEHGIMARPIWELNHRQPMYVDCMTDELQVSDELHREAVSLPSSIGITRAEIQFIAKIIRSTLENS